MGQPSTSNQIRAVALKEAVASMPLQENVLHFTKAQVDDHEGQIIKRAEAFAQYIEHGVEVDPNA